MRAKWWEVAKTQDEIDLFNLLSRNPKFVWRSVNSVISELKWTQEKLSSVIQPFLNNRMIILHRSKKGILLGYWELVTVQQENEEPIEAEDESMDLNVI